MHVAGTPIPEGLFSDAIAKLRRQGFTLRDFQQALEDKGLDPSISYEAAKRQLQRLKRDGAAFFCSTKGLWHVQRPDQPGSVSDENPVSTSTPSIPKIIGRQVTMHSKTDLTQPQPLPGNSGKIPESAKSAPGNSQNSENSQSIQDSHSSSQKTSTGIWLRVLGFPVCLASIGALAAINATFVWDFVQSDPLRWALLAGFLASDLLRPLLIAASFAHLHHAGVMRGFFRFSLGLLVALALSPLSLFSSVSVLSASFQTGEDHILIAVDTIQQRDRLDRQYAQELAQVERLRDLHAEECDRGGCGPIANSIFEKLSDAMVEAEETLESIATLPSSSAEASSLTARTVRSLEAAGINATQQRFLIPLFMALTLELAALFGPALILMRGRRW